MDMNGGEGREAEVSGLGATVVDVLAAILCFEFV
jgi:hypothetical protein